jgi:hypothetical protein
MSVLKEDNYLDIAIGKNIINKLVFSIRKKIFNHLTSWINIENLSTILDVGVCSIKNELGVNFFELLFHDKSKIIAFSDQDASWMESEFPGLKFIRGDGCDLPFEDDSFDLVFSSAVVEHVGNIERQTAFIKECYRVSKKYLFLTTPNRYHPIEFHTALPLIHWLPKPIHRKILSFCGFKDLSLEENLNLLDKNLLTNICHLINITNYSIENISFLLFSSNLLLLASKI